MAKSAEEDEAAAAAPADEASPAAAEPLSPVIPGDEPYRPAWFFDNPSIGRALRYTFQEKRLARAVFVNALLLVVIMAVVQEAFSRAQLGLFSERISYGRVAFLGLVTVEAVVLSILVPLGFVGLFEHERREECFDQVVASGASPHRVVFGRFLATLAFAGVVLLSALPFMATIVVLDGASVGQVLTAYLVLSSYAVALGALALACAVALDDMALPPLVGLVAVVVCLSAGFGRRTPPTFAAWSPVRHAALDVADIAKDLRLGVFSAPDPFGVEVSCVALGLAFYAVAAFLGLAYAFVGPDLELGPGMDAFDSVSTSPRTEVTRARRGVGRALLRAVQLRFFYENVSARAQAAAPAVRALATLVIFAGAHLAFLGGLWPDKPPATFDDMSRTAYSYLGFCLGTLGLLAISGAAARSALLARTPVLALGPLRLTRFATLFLIFAAAVVFPALLWELAGTWTGLPAAVVADPRPRQLYALVAGYSGYVFSVALLLAMLTTNPYSATGRTLIVLFATNITPLVWIPLFTGNLAGKGSSFLLDMSPFIAGYAVARPGAELPFNTFDGDLPVRYDHEPSWVPFAVFHGLVGLGCLVAGSVLAWRELRARRAEASS